jgi:hypothetical protein
MHGVHGVHDVTWCMHGVNGLAWVARMWLYGLPALMALSLLEVRASRSVRLHEAVSLMGLTRLMSAAQHVLMPTLDDLHMSLLNGRGNLDTEDLF